MKRAKAPLAVYDPSIPFKNQRWENFCQIIIQGKSQYDAFCQCYPVALKWKNRHSVDKRASEMVGKIQGRIDWLKSAAATKAMITPERVLREYARIAFSDIGKMFAGEGSTWNLKLLADMTTGQRAAIKKVKITEILIAENVTERKVEVELWSKTTALHDIGDYFRMFSAKMQINQATQINIALGSDASGPKAIEATITPAPAIAPVPNGNGHSTNGHNGNGNGSNGKH